MIGRPIVTPCSAISISIPVISEIFSSCQCNGWFSSAHMYSSSTESLGLDVKSVWLWPWPRSSLALALMLRRPDLGLAAACLWPWPWGDLSGLDLDLDLGLNHAVLECSTGWECDIIDSVCEVINASNSLCRSVATTLQAEINTELTHFQFYLGLYSDHHWRNLTEILLLKLPLCQIIVCSMKRRTVVMSRADG